jgi:hypothetical protein
MRKFFIVFIIFVFSLISLHAANAEEPLLLKKEFTSVTPFFMQGHTGDQNWIEGYALMGDIFLNGSKIGTVNGTVTLLNPPIMLTQHYHEAFGIFNNSITNVGTFQVFAQVKSLSTSDAITTGDGMVAWHGSIVNGSDQFQGISGLSAGVSHYNLFTGQGAGTELLNILFQ